jgi:hypothetical protein
MQRFIKLFVLSAFLLLNTLRAQDEQARVMWTKHSLEYSLPFEFGKKMPEEMVTDSLKKEVLNLLTPHDSLWELKISHVQLKGYTDPVGRASYNQWLSVKRAKVVANLLVEWGVPDSIMKAIGFGEKFADEMKKKGLSHDQMRRVDVALEYMVAKEILPTTTIQDLYAQLKSAPQIF